MKIVLVTGAKGFIGKNLIVALKRRTELKIIVEHDIDSPAGFLEEGLAKANVIYHLAGVNRPDRVEEFTKGNFDLTRQVCDALQAVGSRAPCSCYPHLPRPPWTIPMGFPSAMRKMP